MEKLKCEICGGRLILSRDNIFQCEACGSCYSKEWAQNKVQEITGIVQVEGVATLDNLLKRAQEFAESYDYNKAIQYCDKILDIAPGFIAARELLLRIEENQAVELFKIYQAKVTDVGPSDCTVQLIPSGQKGMIHISRIDNPPPKNVSDVVSVGDILPTVIVLTKTTFHKETWCAISSMPTDIRIGQLLSFDSVETMKRALTHENMTSAMLQSALHIFKTAIKINIDKVKIEMLELLIAKGLHDNPNYAEVFLFTYKDVSGNSWKTKEMNVEIERLLSMGRKCTDILNDFSFFVQLLCFFGTTVGAQKYGYPKTYWYSLEKHGCYYIESDEECYNDVYFYKTDGKGKGCGRGYLDFALGNIIHCNYYGQNGNWLTLMVKFPDFTTLSTWYTNFKNKKCLAGGSFMGSCFGLLSPKSSACGCNKVKFDINDSELSSQNCRFDNPNCPLRYDPRLQLDDPK